MKTKLSLATLRDQLPEPARALRIGRICIPLCIAVGLTAEPLVQWLISFLSALPIRLPL